MIARDGIRKSLPLAISVLMIASLVLVFQVGAASANPEVWTPGMAFRGVSYPAWSADEYTYPSSDVSLYRLKTTGANYVALIVTQYMDTGTSNTIYADSVKTPTDESVIHAIEDIRFYGMKVLLKPHVDCKDGTWRGAIDPSDKEGWFSSYSNFINHYAEIAQNNGVELLCVGTEFKSLSSSAYQSNWSDVISGVRGIYTGSITYAANWDEYKNVSFWDLVDYAGIDAYFPLSDLQSPSMDDLVTGWYAYSGTYGTHNWVGEIENWQASVGKQVIFTEIGYRSIDYAAKEPWSWTGTGTYNGEVQANCYEAAFEVFGGKPWFAGMFWWDWLTDPNAGGIGNTDYTPQNKPAQDILAEHYGRIVLFDFEDGTTQGWVKAEWKGPYLGSPYNSEEIAYHGSRSLAYSLSIPNVGWFDDAGYIMKDMNFSEYDVITMYLYIPDDPNIWWMGGVVFTMSGTDWHWGQGPWVNFEKGTWNKLTLPMSSVSNPNYIRELGFLICGGGNVETTLRIDYVCLEKLLVDTTPPGPPTDIIVAPVKTGTLNISWTNPTDPDFSHIHIYRSTVSGELGDLVYDNVTGTFKQDTSLTIGTTYYYTLRSVDLSGNESTNTDQHSGIPAALVNLALGKTVEASSNEQPSQWYAGEPSDVCDGDMGTRWSSEYSDPQWIYVDLGASYWINRVVLYWETAYGKSYEIQVSNDASNWTTVFSTTSGNGGIDDITFTSTHDRYVRMYGTERGTNYGYSLWEFEVYKPLVVVPATIDFKPDTLNLRSKGKWVTTFIELPEGYDVSDIDVSTVMLNDQVRAENHPIKIGDYDRDGIPDLMVKFDRSDVQKILKVGNKVKITVTGKLTDGTPFEGSDTIRAITKQIKS